jgi:hypothetical protein
MAPLNYSKKHMKAMQTLFDSQGYCYFQHLIPPQLLKEMQDAADAHIKATKSDKTVGPVSYSHYLEPPKLLDDFFRSKELKALVCELTRRDDIGAVIRKGTYRANEFGGKLNVYEGNVNFSPHVDRWTTKGSCQLAVILTVQSKGGPPFHLTLFGNHLSGPKQSEAQAVPLLPGTLTIHLPTVFHEVTPSGDKTTRHAYLMQMSDNSTLVKGPVWYGSMARAGVYSALHYGRAVVKGSRRNR